MVAKLLVLESDWRRQPQQAPTQQRSSAALYASVERLQHSKSPPLHCLSYPLLAHTCAQHMSDFIALPINRRGPNVIIISSHGRWHRRQFFISAGDNLLRLEQLQTQFSERLQRSLVVLDMCQSGAAIQSFCRSTRALGVIGFAHPVDWLGSSLWVLSLLRQWYAAELFAMRRCSSIRPAQVLQKMSTQAHAQLTQRLKVCTVFAHELQSADSRVANVSEHSSLNC